MCIVKFLLTFDLDFDLEKNFVGQNGYFSQIAHMWNRGGHLILPTVLEQYFLPKLAENMVTINEKWHAKFDIF